MFQVGVTGSLFITHTLKGGSKKERKPHRHRYRFEWSLSAPTLNEQGFVADIARMEATRDSLAGRINRVYLNDLPFFEQRQPSLENFSIFFLQELIKAFSKDQPLASNLIQSRIQVWENKSAWASYEIPLGGKP